MDDAPFKKNARYADLYRIPDNWIGEIIDGDLYAFPRARALHALAIGAVQNELNRWGRNRKTGWVILSDVEVRLGKNLLVPDVSGWRRERMPEVPDVVTIKLAPDWVCEGMSPSTARLDKGRKREIYASHGVGHIWYVDPDLHLLDVFELDGTSYRLIESGGGDEQRVFAPFKRKIDLAKLWRR